MKVEPNKTGYVVHCDGDGCPVIHTYEGVQRDAMKMVKAAGWTERSGKVLCTSCVRKQHAVLYRAIGRI